MTAVGAVSPCLLVVEDDPDLRRLLETVLREEGYLVMTAATLAEALQAPVIPDLIIVDVRLPDGDGRQLKGHWSDVPTLTMSGFEEAADLRKPFTMKTLLARLREAYDA